MHLIFITKYRKKIFISQELNTNLKNIIYDIAKKYNYKIIQIETDINHVQKNTIGLTSTHSRVCGFTANFINNGF